MSEIKKPDWLVEGAKVLAYTDDPRYENCRIVAVKKISTKSFTLDHENEPRYSLPDCYARSTSTWSAGRYVVALDSDKARQALRRQAERRQVARARAAVNEWSVSRTKETRLAAIEALQAIEKDEEPES